jgi:hypothetical protein
MIKMSLSLGLIAQLTRNSLGDGREIMIEDVDARELAANKRMEAVPGPPLTAEHSYLLECLNEAKMYREEGMARMFLRMIDPTIPPPEEVSFLPMSVISRSTPMSC